MVMSSLAQQTLVVDWSFTALGFIAVALLFIQRRVVHVDIDFGDSIVVFALITGLLLVCQTTWAIKYEAQAEHQSDVPENDLYKAAMSLTVNEALWSVANASIRTSAGLFYFRLFGPSRLHPMIFAFIVLSVCHGIASLLEVFLICRPLVANWDPTSSGKCGNVLVSYVFLECVGLGLDMVALIIPTILLLRLQLPPAKKMPLIAMFNVGILLFIVTGLRLHALQLAVSPDYTWSESYLGMLSAVGCMTGIFFSVAPVIFSLMMRLSERMSWKKFRLISTARVLLSSVFRAGPSTSAEWMPGFESRRTADSIHDTLDVTPVCESVKGAKCVEDVDVDRSDTHDREERDVESGAEPV